MAVPGQRRGWLLPGLMLMLMLMLLPAARDSRADTGVRVAFSPAWGGRFVPGRGSELDIRLLAGFSGPFRLRIDGGDPVVIYLGTLAPDTPLHIRLPLRPSADRQPTITLIRPGSDTGDSFQPPPFTPVGRGLQVTTDPGQEHAAPLLISDPATLPHTAAGYDPVRHLTIHSRQLARLEAAQLAALGAYIQNCGRLRVNAADTALLNRLRAMAGCRGRFIQSDASSGTADALPGADLLAALERPEPLQGLYFPALWAGGYFLLLLFSHRRPALTLGISGLACLGLFILWPRQQAGHRVIHWAEQESGSGAVRISTLLALSGRREQALRLPLPRRLGLPHTPAAQGPPTLILDQRAPGEQQLAIQTHPFSRQRYLFHSSAPFQAPLRLTLTADGPLVENPATTPAPAALLGWNDEIHRLPPLPPGARWRPDEQSLSEQRTPLHRLLLSRSSGRRPALLLPWSPPLPEQPASDHLSGRGWLLIRAGGDRQPPREERP